MKNRLLILACALVLGELAYLMMGGLDPEKATTGANAPMAPRVPPQVQETPRQKAEFQERIAQLAKLEKAQELRNQLETKERENLPNLDLLLRTRAVAWASALATNWTIYQALRERAAASPSKTTHCTICDGRGLLTFCAVCEHSGKCIYCAGAGRTSFGEICPICHGSGKCYLCFGTGKMPCLFCDDGDIYLKGPPPSTTMPTPRFPTVLPESRRIVAAEPSPIPSAPVVPALERQTSAESASSVAAPAVSIGQQLMLAIVVILCLGFGLRVVAPRIATLLHTHFNPWASKTREVSPLPTSETFKEKSFSRLAESFRQVLDPGSGDSCANAAGLPEPAAAESHEIDASFASLAKHLQIARNFLFEIKRTTSLAGKQKLLAGLLAEVASLKTKSEPPASIAMRQMACALEGLLQQFTRNLDNINLSTFSTVAQAVDLLGSLAVPGLRPDLATTPAPRLLAVDDDPVSRRALALALEAFNEPDLAANGEEALAWAAQYCYDAIFLDVEMPGMDGFELCAKIRETPLNRNTPVVFVTSPAHFDSHAISSRVGDQDFIAKPFHGFEIVVKALALVLSARLTDRDGQFASAGMPRALCRHGELATASVTGIFAPSSTSGNSCRPGNLPGISSAQIAPQPRQPSARDHAETLASFARADLKILGEKLENLARTPDQRLRHETIEELYLGLTAVISGTSGAQLKLATLLASALQGMCQRILEQPARCGPTALRLAADGLDVLDDLCAAAHNPDLDNPALCVLVVDDDPIARRAVSAAVRVACESPVSVPSGEAAVTLATERPFDLIFLDVMMPGMDGFTACRRIHETAPNRQTPVVFVASNGDAEAVAQAIQSGAAGFIAKSALSLEIAVTALTFAARARLGQMQRDCLSTSRSL